MTSRIRTLEQVRAFVEGTEQVDFTVPVRAERHEWIEQTLAGLAYWRLRRRERGMVRAYLGRVTGLSRAQVARLIAQYQKTGRIEDRRRAPAKPFKTRYTAQDAALLAEVDTWHGTLSGPATKKLCERQFLVFGDRRFERLSTISVSHLYNLRRTHSYKRKRGVVTKTQSVQVPIGERRAPRPEGQPGFLRVDSVHSGDWDGVKGLYIVNMVDEVTQTQHMAAVPRLNEACLLPELERLLAEFAFKILAFHTDNGSEYVNYTVADLLHKLLVDFTKSRPRRSNDNALVESKNGSVVRKHLGHAHIPAGAAAAVNVWLREHLCPYLNYHRPCLFPVTQIDAQGRQRKRYPYDQVMTPYEKLKSLPNAALYLKPGTTFDRLDALARESSDHEAVQRMQRARDRLFRTFTRMRKLA